MANQSAEKPTKSGLRSWNHLGFPSFFSRIPMVRIKAIACLNMFLFLRFGLRMEFKNDFVLCLFEYMKLSKLMLLAASVLTLSLGPAIVHGGATLTTLASFNNTNNGANPYAPPVLFVDGNLYGVTPSGGTNGVGIIYQVTTNAQMVTLHTFNTADGSYPLAQLTPAGDGNIYGTTSSGGTHNAGTIFSITTNGLLTTLYSFGAFTNELGYALDGKDSYAGMVQGKDGNFYGMTYDGGISNVGTVFQYSTNGAFTTLYSFTGNGSNDAGTYPYTAPLVEGAPGIFYGTTSEGGTNNDGTIFQITSNGVVTTLYEFDNADGKNPYAGLSWGSDGNLYGTTVYGGTNGYGTAFQITTNGVLTTLFQFGGTDGLYYPEGGVVPGNDNTLFGTTYYDSNYGSVFQLTTNGLLTTLHSFTNGVDGGNPYAGVIRDATGNLYGAALYGGDQGGNGTVYRVSFSALLSIISPKANEFSSNGVYTVTGTASDNAPGTAITNVLFSLNGAAWTAATTANGWINWTGSVTLAPGTNILQAYAMDAAGNLSDTDAVTFVYGATLTVLTNGLGSVSPNYNGALLPIGGSYSMTATAANGFNFSNWTGGTNQPLAVVTNKATVQFVVEPNLTLQANFTDKTKPTLSITNVTKGMSVSDAAFTVKGKAGDNWQVAEVFYSLNGEGWGDAVTANGWTNWSAAVTLVPGTNTVAAYAVDPTGLASLTNTVSFVYVVTNQLHISAVGLGSISPNYSNSWLVIGRNYSMKATAKTGFVFTNWTDGSGNMVTNNATLKFMMVSNLAFVVNFQDTVKPAITITAPASGQHMTNALATVTGKASDNWQVAGVWYQLNNGKWSQPVSTNIWTNWTAMVELQAATNTIKAYALDSGGNFSATNSVSFVSSNAFKLELSFPSSQPLVTNGLNLALQLSPGLNGHILVSTNLADWATLTNFVGTNASLNFLDATATNLNLRFYRAVIP